MTGSELAALGRLGRRTARREWKRTSLIAALVAVPVAAALVVAGIMHANDIPQEEQAAATFGAAEVRVESWIAAGDREQIDVQAWVERTIPELAPDAEVLGYRNRHGRQLGEIVDLDIAAPIAEGILFSWEGRLPSAPDEIAVSPRVLRRLHAAVGDTVTVDGQQLTVVGTVVDTVRYNSEVTVTTPAGFDRLAEAEGARGEASVVWLLDDVEHPSAFAAAFTEAWQADLPSLLPEPAVTPVPEALATLHPTIYAALTAEQIEELVAAAPTMSSPDQLHHLAGEMIGDSGVVTAVEPYPTTREQFLGYGGDDGLTDRVMTPGVVATLVAAVLLAEVALIAGAAYATGTRRRLRELGLLGATGATVNHIRVAVLGEAATAGLVGGVAGIGLGIAALLLGRPLIQLTVDRYLTGIPLTAGAIIGPVMAGTVAILVAAWLPARTAAQVPTMTALGGRMPLSEPPRWLIPGGLALTAFGALLTSVALAASSTAATLMGVVGVLAAVIGMALLTPPIIARVGRIADRLPATLRLAIRDSARQRTRAAAATAAAMVLLMAPVLIGFDSATMQAQALVRGLPDPGDQVLFGPSGWNGMGVGDGSQEEEQATLERIRELLPAATEVSIPVVDVAATPATAPDERRRALAGDFGAPIAEGIGEEIIAPWELSAGIATPQLIDVLDSPRVEETITGGTPVVLGVEDRPTTVTLRDGTSLEARELPVAVNEGLPRLLLPSSAAESLGYSTTATLTLFDGVELTGELQEDLWDAATGGSLVMGWPNMSPESTRWMAMGATLAVVLLVLVLVTALSATESDHDLRTMVAVGAPPRIRRRFLGLQTGYHALIGALLAIPLAAGLYWASTRGGAWPSVGPFGARMSDQLAVPWLTIALVLLAVPAVIGAFTTGAFRSAATVPPRRIG